MFLARVPVKGIVPVVVFGNTSTNQTEWIWRYLRAYSSQLFFRSPNVSLWLWGAHLRNPELLAVLGRDLGFLPMCRATPDGVPVAIST
jgi:hypothetical protein